MKVCTILCDICHAPIESDHLFTLKSKEFGETFKRVGCDKVLTPRKKRFYVPGTDLMIRINASFYIGTYSTNIPEIHFHNDCIDREITHRLQPFLISDSADS